MGQLIRFRVVVAPFDGVITSRQGDLGRPGERRCELARTDLLRMPWLRTRISASKTISQPTLRYRSRLCGAFQDKLARTAVTLQPDTRTVLAELEVDDFGRDADRRPP